MAGTGNQIGKRIADIRKKMRFTQMGLALELGVSPQAVSKWERGENDPSIEMIVKMSDVLRTTTDHIICNDGADGEGDAVSLKISFKDLMYLIHDMDPEEVGLSKQPFHTLEGVQNGLRIPIQFIQDERVCR